MGKITLKKNQPYLFETNTNVKIQNTMFDKNATLYVSKTGDLDEPWLEIYPGKYLNTRVDLYLKQTQYNSINIPYL